MKISQKYQDFSLFKLFLNWIVPIFFKYLNIYVQIRFIQFFIFEYFAYFGHQYLSLGRDFQIIKNF